ncbi:MAG TPA: DUF6049 family protein [Actinocrinis sp.]|uniref:DUF6049 family protein n=1 Tax=Actinocrinis sp. TaxID=1920516 RepID=UPI002DDCFE33|nr:DUF6049 family protein [Actinocrinis sp.]HEV3171464.1 DUF6049 family protein [Actinocrinis sp.]
MRFRRALRPLALSLASLAAVLVSTSTAPMARAASGGTVAVGLSSMSPAIAVRGDTLKLQGDLVGSAGVSHPAVTVRLAVAELIGRSEMANTAGSHSQLVFGHQDDVGNVTVGATVPWSLSVPIADMGLNGRGVYALDVEAYSEGVRIGALRTYLPYEMNSDTSLKPTQMVLVWPVVGTPALDGQASNGVDEAVTDDLSTQFAANGRLYQVLAAGSAAATANRKIAVSWLVDPDLLATAADEQNGYTLYSTGPTSSATSTDSGAQNAQRWLAEAKTVLGTTGELWQLPATDPDFGSLAAGDPAFAAATVKNAAQQTGSTVVTSVGRTPLGTLAWPADGQVNAPTLKLAEQVNPAATIVGSDSIDLHTRADIFTPTGRVNLSDGSHLAVSDADLDAIFAGDAADAAYRVAGTNSSLLTSQRFLAQSALIALEEPNLSPPRTVMVTAPRGVQPDPALLAAVGSASWIKTVGLSTLLNTSPDGQAQTSTPKRASATAKSDLTPDQLTATGALGELVQSLAQILFDPTKVTQSYGPASLRTMSTSWRGDTAGQAAFTRAVHARVTTIVNAVRLVPKSDLTLSGKSGVIPFTVQNELNENVSIGIRITTDRPGLSVQQVQVQTFHPGSTTVDVHVSSTVSGQRVMVTAQLVTPGGNDYGDSQSLQVTVSSIGSVTLVIFGLSAALLVVAVMLRIYRSRRTRTAPPVPDPPGTPAENAASVEAERGQ